MLAHARSSGYAIERIDESGRSLTLGQDANLVHNGLWLVTRVAPKTTGNGSFITLAVRSKSFQAGLSRYLDQFAASLRAHLAVQETSQAPVGLAEQLDQLCGLRSTGMLSQEEFEAAKARLLATS